MSPTGIIRNIYKPSSAGKRIIVEVHDENGYVNDLSVNRKDYYQLEMEFGDITGCMVKYKGNKILSIDVEKE